MTFIKWKPMHQFKRAIASSLIVSTLALGLPMSAQAGIVATDTSLGQAASAAQRDKVNTFLMREDVRKGLQDQGVSADDALERVQTMSDPEVAQLAGRIDQAPAGGDILGVLFTVFIVLLVTDILGLTKVYPFTRSIR
jgi:hypothetical protein